MTYNELAQVLESTNPKTGKLYTLKDLNVIKMQDAGTGMLEDGLSRPSRISRAPPTRRSPSRSSRQRCRAGFTAATTRRSASR